MLSPQLNFERHVNREFNSQIQGRIKTVSSLWGALWLWGCGHVLEAGRGEGR